MTEQEKFKAVLERNQELEEMVAVRQETQGFASSNAVPIVISNQAPQKPEERKRPKWETLREEYMDKTQGVFDETTRQRLERATKSKDEDALELLLLELKSGPSVPTSFVSTEFTAGIHFRRLSFIHLAFTLFFVVVYQAFSMGPTLYVLTPSQCRPYLPQSSTYGISFPWVFWIPGPDPDQTHLGLAAYHVVDWAAVQWDGAVGAAWQTWSQAYSESWIQHTISSVFSYAHVVKHIGWYWLSPDAVLMDTCVPVIENRVKWVLMLTACSFLLSVYRVWSVTHVKLQKIMAKHHFHLVPLDPVDLAVWQVNNRHPSLRYGRTLEASEPRRVEHWIQFHVPRSRGFGYFTGISTLIVDWFSAFWLSAEGVGPGFQEADDFWCPVPANTVRGLKNSYHRFSTARGCPREAREIFGTFIGPNLDGKIVDNMKFDAFTRQASIIGCDSFEKMAKNVELAVKTANWSAENWRASDPASAMVLMNLTAYRWLAVVHDAHPKVREDIKWSF